MDKESCTLRSLSGEKKTDVLRGEFVPNIGTDSNRYDEDQALCAQEGTDFSSILIKYARATPWRVYLVRLAWFFVPSYLQNHHGREPIRSIKPTPTTYLDGMRGVAALAVFFCHFFYQAFVISKGWGCEKAHYDILKLPILRLWFQGPPAVCLFFVVSGYALSYRPLKLVRNQNKSELLTVMSSMAFRRGIRLFLPAAISTLVIVCFIRLGIYEWTREFSADSAYVRNIREPHPPRLTTSYAQLADWADEMFSFIHVFGWKTYGGSTNYDQHLWTIPVEFRCSLYLLLTILATSQLRTQCRFVTIIGIILFTYRNSRWEFLMFLCGMIISEVDLIRGAHLPLPTLPIAEKTPPPQFRWLESIFWTFLNILSLYMMSQPDEGGDKTPGWKCLTALIPRWWSAEVYRYWQCTGAVLFFISVGRSAKWQRLFNSTLAQYLGKISYSLYLVHGLVIHTAGYYVEGRAYKATGTEGHRFIAGFVLSSFLVVPITFWCADIFWRAVDIPTVKFSKWWENKLIERAG